MKNNYQPHFLVSRTSLGAFLTLPNDMVSVFSYPNSITQLDEDSIKKLISYPIVSKETGWILLKTVPKQQAREWYYNLTQLGFNPVKP